MRNRPPRRRYLSLRPDDAPGNLLSRHAAKSEKVIACEWHDEEGQSVFAILRARFSEHGGGVTPAELCGT